MNRIVNRFIKRDCRARSVSSILIGDSHGDSILPRTGIGMRHLVLRTRGTIAKVPMNGGIFYVRLRSEMNRRLIATLVGIDDVRMRFSIHED